jgi:hypothetical protein
MLIHLKGSFSNSYTIRLDLFLPVFPRGNVPLAPLVASGGVFLE